MPTLAQYDSLFNTEGDCPNIGDPYRGEVEERSPAARMLFDEQGYLTEEARQSLRKIVTQRATNGCQPKPFALIIRLLVSDDFANNTRGHYSTIYMWR